MAIKMIALISQLVTNLKDKPSAGSAPPATQGRVVVPVVPVPGDSVDEFWVLTGLRWGHQGVCVCVRAGSYQKIIEISGIQNSGLRSKI